MSVPQTKLMNFEKALNRLQEGIQLYDGINNLARDGLIQRFEFTFELAWKTMQSCFEKEGLFRLNSPKTVLREAFSAGLINDEKLWLSMLMDRNSTQIYNEQLANQICNNVESKYSGTFEELVHKLRKRIRT